MELCTNVRCNNVYCEKRMSFAVYINTVLRIKTIYRYTPDTVMYRCVVVDI